MPMCLGYSSGSSFCTVLITKVGCLRQPKELGEGSEGPLRSEGPLAAVLWAVGQSHRGGAASNESCSGKPTTHAAHRTHRTRLEPTLCANALCRRLAQCDGTSVSFRRHCASQRCRLSAQLPEQDAMTRGLPPRPSCASHSWALIDCTVLPALALRDAMCLA